MAVFSMPSFMAMASAALKADAANIARQAVRVLDRCGLRGLEEPGLGRSLTQSPDAVIHSPADIVADGAIESCLVLDFSVSGAAVSANMVPRIGTVLAIGTVIGLFKIVLAAVLLVLIAAARLPFIANILAGEEGEFAALVLNDPPTSELDPDHLPRRVAGSIDGTLILGSFQR